MEGFSMIFRNCINEAAEFGYHVGCQPIGITHLCFADDLFVFTRGDVASVEVLKKALDLFAMCSGLTASLDKSEIFFGNVPDSEQQAILNCLPFRKGTFPIRYLGVPLSPVTLRVADYGPLITKVRTRIQNWKSKFLSYGGRKQLVSSVLQSLQLYWMGVFVLPSVVIHEIEAMFRDFLWAHGSSSKGRCRVAWAEVCKTHENGGLGLRRMTTWNRALVSRNLWDILSEKNSLWTTWVKRYYLQSLDFWTCSKKPKWSWVFRKMMELRDTMKVFIRWRLGDGRSINAWEDCWLPCAPLISYRRIHASGFHRNMSAREFLLATDGSWPEEWTTRFPQLLSFTLPVLSMEGDVVQWDDGDNHMADFSVARAYSSFDGRHDLVPWHGMVWYKGHVPKYSFCLWLACLRRHPTQDRLRSWKDDPPDLKCSLCDVCEDSHEHLFFSCPFALSIWREVKMEFTWSSFPDDWDNIMIAISDPAGANFSYVRKLVLAVSVYMSSSRVVDHQEFIPVVLKEWKRPVFGSFMHKLVTHLKNLKQPLRKLRGRYGEMSKRVDDLRSTLNVIQLAVDLNPLDRLIKEELSQVRLDYQQARLDEESYYRQRAKIRWLNQGDSNTKFFHNAVKEKRNRNCIRSVLDAHGTLVRDDDVPNVFLDHFRSFLGMRDPLVQPEVDQDLFYNPLSLGESLDIIRPITDGEIKDALFGIGNDKAPGSDGFSSKFFKSAWGVIGNDLMVAVHNFFYTGRILKEINHTLLCFIPKIPNATRVADFRPISCCSVLYKVISKVIAERMKPYLAQLVGPTQSAFIPGRRIADNIMMAHELVVGYQRQQGQPRCAFKIDLRKAYDTVDWRYLACMLSGLGFHPVFCKWIDELLNTSSFSIVLNGETHGFFKGARGLRQGDPISPYLFTIVMEGFSRLLKKCIDEAVGFGYHEGCADLHITHLCFADDLFVFTRGDLASVEVIKKALELFRVASGLEPNLSKSEVFFCNVCPEDRNVILNYLPLQTGTFPIRYLGIPLSPVCLRVADFAPLVNKVKARIHDWKAKFLSFAGRKQLIISVLQSLQLYWMAIYIIPSGVIHELESLFRSFLWAQGDDARGRCKLSWDVVCQPIQSGGLGIRRLSSWNRALVSKHIWDILSNRNSLWVSWIRSYRLQGVSFWTIRSRGYWPWIFRKILDLRESIRMFFRFIVGNGDTINAWVDNWYSGGPLSMLISFRRFHSAGFGLDTTARDLITRCNGAWPPTWVELNPVQFANPPPNIVHGAVDTIKLVQGSNLVDFTVKDAWKAIVGTPQMLVWTKYVWFKGHIPKHGFCMWTACHRRLPTQDRIGNWKHDPPDYRCVFCKGGPDSHDHLFFLCPFSVDVWRRVKSEVGLHGFPERWSDILNLLEENRGPRKNLQKLALAGTVYFIWIERNRRLFKDLGVAPIQLFKQIREVIWTRVAWRKVVLKAR
ncbi:hypothetical protein OSB04_un000109 [Centaurea solstitialis]|uniref:Reverse transcriptase domain-containing protein n=1 Tax=Centaurea solstitialis TaxID=347529 RepID=A0AA38S6W9_9ASTR|nr:hypothetical protein OSB04_un000109 [Centaurea solstitialis]